MAAFIGEQKFLIKEINRDNEIIDMKILEIHVGELTARNPLTEELTIDFNCKASDAVIGYACYFELLNGLKKSVYWSVEDMKKYRKKLSNELSEEENSGSVSNQATVGYKKIKNLSMSILISI